MRVCGSEGVGSEGVGSEGVHNKGSGILTKILSMHISCTQVPYRDSCCFAVLNTFMVAINSVMTNLFPAKCIITVEC